MAERLSRGMILRRRLPSRLGGDTVLVSPDSALRFWRWNLDKCAKSLFDFAEEFVKPGDVVWDLGANIGMFTFPSSFLAGPSGCVVAIDADIFSVGLLRQSALLASPGRAKVIVLPVAVSDSMGIVQLNIANRGRNANFLASLKGSTQAGGVRETVSVMAVTLDWLMERLPPPKVLKIDIEGAEALVLNGASKLLSTARPPILCEVNEHAADACTALFKSFGYKIYDFYNRERGPLDRAPFETLAVFEG
jgi:FkbM family methyltransferase